MSEPYIGEIRMFGGNFAPRGWALCDGQLLAISQNTALFSLLGTTFGGDGRTTFGLPDLRGRAPMHWGQGPGLANRVLGESAGEEAVTLLGTQLPPHNHIVAAVSGPGNAGSPPDALWAASSSRDSIYSTTAPDTQMSPQAIGGGGGGQPHDNMSPYLVVTFIIALEGIYPPRP
jgi:microcystin-dependent protein